MSSKDLCYLWWATDIVDSCPFDPALWWLQHWLPGTDHYDVIKWKHFPHYWPFVRGIHRSQMNSPHKGQWHRVLMFSSMYASNGWVNNQDTGDLSTHYDVTVMILEKELVTQNHTSNSVVNQWNAIQFSHVGNQWNIKFKIIYQKYWWFVIPMSLLKVLWHFALSTTALLLHSPQSLTCSELIR